MKKPEPVYTIDQVLRENGHEAIRLPPYHADLNPIEMIWSQLKGNVPEIESRYRLKKAGDN